MLLVVGFSPKRLTILQKKVVRILARRPYISHTTSIFKDLKILKLKDQYSIQLYKLYHKNTNNLLPSYFNSFTPYYDVEHNHDLRYTALRLPMTRREYFVQSTRYQFLKLIRETSVIDLNRPSPLLMGSSSLCFTVPLYCSFTCYCYSPDSRQITTRL